MKLRLALLVAFLLNLCVVSALAQSGGGETEEKPFYISSRGTPFGLQAEFEGTYRVYEGSVEVYVRKATFYVSEKCPYQGRRAINRLKFGLAKETTPGGRWDMERKVQPVYVSVLMSPTEEFSLYNLYFSLPKESTTDLGKRWFVVEMQEDAIDAHLHNEDRTGYAFAHSARDIFVSSRSETSRR